METSIVLKRIISGLIMTGFIIVASSAVAAQPPKDKIEQKTSIEEKKDVTPNKQLSNREFLEANKERAGVVTLADGLQYKVIKEGDGPQPKSSDTVMVHYNGIHIDGTEFDSSYQRGEPAHFPVNAVIAGWTEALQLMKVGSIWELYIPGSLAYGEDGMPPVIAPNETLIFKVELLGIK